MFMLSEMWRYFIGFHVNKRNVRNGLGCTMPEEFVLESGSQLRLTDFHGQMGLVPKHAFHSEIFTPFAFLSGTKFWGKKGNTNLYTTSSSRLHFTMC